MNAAPPLPIRPLPPTSYANHLQSWKPWYDQIIDWFLSHPGGSVKQCAADLRRTPSWVGQLMRADFFQTRYAERRSELTAELGGAVQQKLQEVALASLEVTLDRLRAGKGAAVSTKEATKIMDSSLAALGYGRPSEPAGQTTQLVVNVGVTQQGLAQAREVMRANEEATAALPERRRVSEGHASAPGSGPHVQGPVLDLSINQDDEET